MKNLLKRLTRSKNTKIPHIKLRPFTSREKLHYAVSRVREIASSSHSFDIIHDEMEYPEKYMKYALILLMIPRMIDHMQHNLINNNL